MNDFAIRHGYQPGARSVAEFCANHGIGRTHFYALLKEGKAPRVMKIGKRTLVSDEAAADWRREREAEAVVGGRA